MTIIVTKLSEEIPQFLRKEIDTVQKDRRTFKTAAYTM